MVIFEDIQTQDDTEKIKDVIQLLQNTETPVFIHLHLMSTHGAKFFPSEQVYSAGKDRSTQEPWDGDFYDDVIRITDHKMDDIIDALENKDLLDETLVIFGSDHDQLYNPMKRIPLIMRFPGGEFSGKIAANVQDIDIPPTILDYMGLPIPEWMQGQSLLQPLEQRPIVGTGVLQEGKVVRTDEEGDLYINYQESVPPFYQFKYISIVYCQQWYQLSFEDYQLRSGPVQGHTAACPAGGMPPDEQVKAWMVDYLKSFGFDTSAIKR